MLQSQLDAIQTMNAQVAGLNQLLNELRAICPADDNAAVTIPRNVQNDLQAAGIAVDTTQTVTGKDVKQWITEIKVQIDSLNSTMQLNMIQLQSEMNKQNEAYQMQSEQIAKMQNDMNSIIKNMR